MSDYPPYDHHCPLMGSMRLNAYRDSCLVKTAPGGSCEKRGCQPGIDLRSDAGLSIKHLLPPKSEEEIAEAGRLADQIKEDRELNERYWQITNPCDCGQPSMKKSLIVRRGNTLGDRKPICSACARVQSRARAEAKRLGRRKR